jgi:pyruvate dehydrogenase E2 component (dihydrolipoamide acetyltransferase)
VIEDLRTYIQNLQSQAAQGPSAAAAAAPQRAAAPAESIDFSKWGPVTKKAISSLRKTIGQKMQESWQTVPHVTQFDEADITAMMELRKKYNPIYEKKKANLTVTVLVLKAVVAALKKIPLFNSSLDEVTGEVVLKNYYHLGIAVDTEAGLIVPVLKDVDKKSVLDLALELAAIAEKTRQRKISVDDLQGGTFTISNLGSIGGQHFTPIVNKPQAAILGLSRGFMKPVVKDGKVEPRLMMPVALSYDHRIVDGADGARFMKELIEGFQNPVEKDLILK